MMSEVTIKEAIERLRVYRDYLREDKKESNRIEGVTDCIIMLVMMDKNVEFKDNEVFNSA